MRLVVLRQMSDEDGTRYLAVRNSENGDLIIEGQDLGPGVERMFGVREYEWIWTIKKADLPKLSDALGCPADILTALRERFSGDHAAELWSFLRDKSVPMDVWSRKGD